MDGGDGDRACTLCTLFSCAGAAYCQTITEVLRGLPV